MSMHYVQMCKYGVISGPFFPVFWLNTGKNEPEITPYLDTFHTVIRLQFDLLRCVLAIKTTQKCGGKVINRNYTSYIEYEFVKLI